MYNIFIMMDHAKRKGQEHFNPVEDPIFATVVMGDIFMFITDPEITQELYTKHEHKFTKDGKVAALLRTTLGHGFLFSPGDDLWQRKSKYMKPAFYKQNIIYMQKHFQWYCGQYFKDWIDRIKKSPDGKITLNMYAMVQEIMSGNICTVGCGGVDISKYMTDQIYVSKEDPSKLEKV